FACGKMKKAKVVDNLLDKAKSLTEKKEGVEIIKAEKFKSYSVADELMKWAELKKKGSITEDEYLAAKDKLLKA
ncbi:MAG: hypothetical protein GY845_39315, partial [Planctomycetes bacterium]|nr:hypothetical protein [Planctomycetota bacterium]